MGVGMSAAMPERWDSGWGWGCLQQCQKGGIVDEGWGCLQQCQKGGIVDGGGVRMSAAMPERWDSG